MPELPEVETVRRALALHVAGSTVTAVGGRRVLLRRRLDPARLAQALTGRYLAEPRRRGKFLLLDTRPAGSLLVHLGMTGRLQLVDHAVPTAPHTHLVISLDQRRELRFVDPRRFGLVHWLEPGEEATDPSLSRLGVEPLDPALPRLLPPLLRRRRAPIKSLLLDQSLLAGVGNIYAVEALWRARIRPLRPAASISTRRLQRLVHELQQLLAEAIEAGGTTIRDFVSPAGSQGTFAFALEAYGRHGSPCLRCGAPLRNSAIAGRSTAWCPRCQR